MKRRICYITGTRADFGLMESTLRRINAHPNLALTIAVTGMHLSPTFGSTVREIERSGYRISGRIPVDVESGDGAGMARALAVMLVGFVAILQAERPDLVLVLGDRGEMLAGALAAIHLNLPIVHLHGGERSGTVDEPVRHAISKLAHYHFVATKGSRDRLVRMGEDAVRVFVTGAPGLDDLSNISALDRVELCTEVGLDPARPVVLMVYHPVLQSAANAGRETAQVLAGVRATAAQVVCLAPNSDAGHQAVRAELASQSGEACRFVTHFPRNVYLSWLEAADVLVGNSSSGIIEAASFGLPVVNVGDRQRGRERNSNTIDVPAESSAVTAAISAALARGRLPRQNIYGDGHAGEAIVALLSSLSLSDDLLHKSNAY